MSNNSKLVFQAENSGPISLHNRQNKQFDEWACGLGCLAELAQTRSDIPSRVPTPYYHAVSLMLSEVHDGRDQVSP